jgi:hypothetical protein
LFHNTKRKNACLKKERKQLKNNPTSEYKSIKRPSHRKGTTMTAETKYKWVCSGPETDVVSKDILNKLDSICIEWDKEKDALGKPINLDVTSIKDVSELFKLNAKPKKPSAKEKAKYEAYCKKSDEIDLKQMQAIQALLLKKSEACGPMSCGVYSSRITYGTSSQFVPMEIIIGGPSAGTTVSSKYSGTELEVACPEHPQLKKIRFEGAAHIEAGDTIKAYSFRGLRIDHILPNAVNHWYDLIHEKKEQVLAFS